MPPFSVNTHRFDPYKAFRFRVRWDGRIVAGVSRVSALQRSTAVVQHREGDDVNRVRPSPGLTRFEPITLERGVTHDTAFEEWADLTHRTDTGGVTLKAYRKDVSIELCNEAGQVVLAYRVYRCWVSAYQALPELDAAASVVAIESITLQHEGWERDTSVVEPAETGAT